MQGVAGSNPAVSTIKTLLCRIDKGVFYLSALFLREVAKYRSEEKYPIRIFRIRYFFVDYLLLIVTVTSPSGPLVAINSSPEPGVITSVLEERTPAGASEFIKPKKLVCVGCAWEG